MNNNLCPFCNQPLPEKVYFSYLLNNSIECRKCKSKLILKSEFKLTRKLTIFLLMFCAATFPLAIALIDHFKIDGFLLSNIIGGIILIYYFSIYHIYNHVRTSLHLAVEKSHIKRRMLQFLIILYLSILLVINFSARKLLQHYFTKLSYKEYYGNDFHNSWDIVPLNNINKYTIKCLNETSALLEGQFCQNTVFKDGMIIAHCGKSFQIFGYMAYYVPACKIAKLSKATDCISFIKSSFLISKDDIPYYNVSENKITMVLIKKLLSNAIYTNDKPILSLYERSDRLEIHDSESITIISNTGWVFVVITSMPRLELSNNISVQCNIEPTGKYINSRYNLNNSIMELYN